MTTAAGPEAVFELIGNGASWPVWGTFDSYELVQPGETETDGVGSIRIFRTGRIAAREQIVESVPGQRLAYVMLSGLPLRDYRAAITLEHSTIEPGAGGTVVSWRSTFRPKLPGTGWLYRRAIRSTIKRSLAGLVRHVEAGTASTGA